MESAQFAQVAQQTGAITLLGTALALGFRHGIDWDHIAAITDITSTTTSIATTDLSESRPDAAVRSKAARNPAGFTFGKLELRALGLATLYALGHALVVACLGFAALYFEAILPAWVDPVMERVVGLTLLVLGVWVFYSLVRYWRGEADFRLRSRWMLVFAGVRHAWHLIQHRLTGHAHEQDLRVDEYGLRTAFGVGMIHGIGAETGSQVLIIAAVGGAASQGLGTAMLVAFLVGLLLSNGTLAFLTATGFISSTRAKGFYVVVGLAAGLFSLFVGTYFALGLSDRLPDLQLLFGFIGGTPGGD